MSPDAMFLLSMTISIIVFMNLSRKLGWSDKLWKFLASRFKVDPSYNNSLSVVIAITIPVIIMVIFEILGFDRYWVRIIHGASIGFAVSFVPMNNNAGLKRKYIRNKGEDK